MGTGEGLQGKRDLRGRYGSGETSSLWWDGEGYRCHGSIGTEDERIQPKHVSDSKGGGNFTTHGSLMGPDGGRDRNSVLRTYTGERTPMGHTSPINTNRRPPKTHQSSRDLE